MITIECNKCSYEKGYHNQIIFGCKTCGTPKGFCLGCAVKCHQDHEIFEVGDRKHFRCDCPGPSGSDKKCEFLEQNEDEKTKNLDNIYNHNFDKLFCKCNDPCDNESDMIQCNGCEDFFHLQCLNVEIKQREYIRENEESENLGFFCVTCINNNFEHLKNYKDLLIQNYSDFESRHLSKYDKKKAELLEMKNTPDNHDNIINKDSSDLECLGKRSFPGESDQNSCFQPNKNCTSRLNQGVFFVEGWEKKVCKCEPCQDRMRIGDKFQTVFEEDSDVWAEERKVFEKEKKQEIENEPPQAHCSEEEKANHEMGFLTNVIKNQLKRNLTHAEELNLATAYGFLKDKIGDFMERMQGKKTPIEPKDVHTFIEDILKEKNSVSRSDYSDLF